ncbi:MAG: PEGA domain-containing protein [Muribaculaceae bacterium]|nr:PEGA domain-containing protein [Muribaculaceae bacterium]
MRLIYSLILVLTAVLPALAQQLRPLSLEPVSDVLRGSMIRPDANGVEAALVKVLLPVQGVEFDGNMIGDAEFHTNEYWVWLEAYREGISPGTREFKIHCPGAETLRVCFTDFSDIALLSPKTAYELRLDVPPYLLGRPSGPADPGGNYFVLSVTPKSNVVVHVDGQLAEVADGETILFCRYGDHSYSVEAPGYLAEKGAFTIMKGGDKVVKNVTLQSRMSNVTVTAATPGTVISLNGQRKGTGSWSGALGAGTYQLEATLEGHEPYRTSFDVAERETRTVEIPALTPIYARLDVTCKPAGATITIDGKQAGTTPQVFTELLEGRHKLTVSSPGYQTLTRDLTLSAAQPVTVAEALTKKTTVSKKGDGLRKAQHLSLCVSDKDGNIFYFTDDQWKNLSSSDKSDYKPKGVVIKDETDAFLVAMEDAGEGNWDYACRNGAPSIERLKLIYKYRDSLNKKLRVFGREGLLIDDWYWSSTEFDSSYASIVDMGSGHVFNGGKTSAIRVRAVALVSEAVAM